MSSIQKQADTLRQEAQELLYNLIPNANGRNVNRLVECIITATVLEILALQEQSTQPDVLKR